MEVEIKFRWVGRNRKFDEIQINSDLTTSKLLSGNVLSFFNTSNRGKEGNCEFISEELFTGLKDKNGVEIYEGDVVFYHGSKGFVFYQNDTCMFLVKFPINRSQWSFDSMDEEIEIIGNIHENPELLC